MTRVLVTGGSGKLGRAVLRDLVDHGYNVVSVDQQAPAERICPSLRIDLTDFGDVAAAILGGIDSFPGRFDAVVHLAAIASAGQTSNAGTFVNNVTSTYNVFEACRLADVDNIVFASSETLLGLPFDTPPPYLPVDERFQPRPESAYSLGKLLDETMAREFCRWNPSVRITGLRFSNVMAPEDYAAFPSYDADPLRRKWNLWGYIDSRDGAQAVRLGLEADFAGFETFIIANADTVMSRTSASLAAEVFPGVPLNGELEGTGTLLDIAKARRMLGYEPAHSWRNDPPTS